MTEVSSTLRILFAIAGACGVAAALGASFTLGAAVVCRWMKWAPVNTTVIINMDSPADRGGK